jgi:trigger factor
MKLTINYDKKISIKFKVTAELDAKDLKKQRSNAIKVLGKGVKVQGFRAGTAPEKLVEEKLDPSQIASETASRCVDTAFAGSLKEFKLDILGTPKLEIKEFIDNEKMVIEFIGNIKPEVTLPEFSKWPKLKLGATKVDPKEVQATLDQLQQNMAKAEEVERPAKDGDRVWLDFEGFDEAKKPVPGAASKNYPLVLGSRSFIPGFEEEVIGMKIDQEKEFEVTFPKDYHSQSLQNKKVTFKIKIKKIAELKKPEVNDEFAEKLGGFKTLGELKKDIEDGIKERAERNEKEEFKDKLAEKLGAESKFETPDVLVEENVEAGINNAKREAEGRGQDFNEWLNKRVALKTKSDLIAKEARPQAERQVRASIALRAVAEQEKLSVTKEELAEYTSVLLQQYGHGEAQKQIMSPQEQARIEGRLLADKVLNFLLSKVS